MLSSIVIVVLIIALLGTVPTWPYNRNWSYYPSSGIGVVLIVLLVLVAMGRL